MHYKKTRIAFICILLSFLSYGCGSFFSRNGDSALPASSQWTEETDKTSEDISGDDMEDGDNSDNHSEPDAAENKYDNLNITEKTLVIPELTGNYSFLFLADTHMIKLNGTEDEPVRGNALPRIGMFKDSQSIYSYKNFPVWMEYANESDIDMVLLGGDIIDFPSEMNLQLLTENLESLQKPYAFILGNHDWTYPWEYMTATGRKQYRPLFSPFTGENSAARIIECEELIILCVDNSSNQVEAEALPVVEEALSMGKPVIVMLHVPFSTDTLLKKAATVWNSPVSVSAADKDGISPNADTLTFQEKILDKSSPVVCVLAGHVHFPDEAMLTDSIIQYVTGAGYLNEGIFLKIQGE